MTTPANRRDEFYPVRTQFYLGQYQTALNHANNLHSQSLTKNLLIHRCFLAQKKHQLVLNELNSTASNEPELLAIHALALMAQKSSSEKADELIQRAVDGLAQLGDKERQACVAALIAEYWWTQGRLEDAMKLVSSYVRVDLECAAMLVQLLIRVNRLDVAQQQLEVMKVLGEDHTLTQLAEAWLNMATGGDKYQQAFYIFQELMDANGPSAKLLNGQATCLMHMGKFEEAEKLLLEALSKKNDDAETLSNMIVCCQHLHKPVDLPARYFAQLKDSAPNHPMVQDTDLKSTYFDRLAQKFAMI